MSKMILRQGLSCYPWLSLSYQRPDDKLGKLQEYSENLAVINIRSSDK